MRIFNPSLERLEGPGIVDMAYPIVQDHDLPEGVAKALYDAVGRVHRYPHGEDAVREAIATYVGVRPDNILPTTGANGALDLVARAWARGKSLVVPKPAFWQLVEAPLRYGARLSHPDLLEPEFPSELLAEFAQADGIVLCSPNNPLGQVFPSSLLAELLSRSGGRPVIVDESYVDLLEPAPLEAIHDDLILVRGFKTFLIPGVRAGYIVASNRRVQELASLRPPFESNVFAEAAILACLNNLGPLRRIWKQVRDDLLYLENGIRELGGSVRASCTLFCAWHYDAAQRIGRELASQGIFTIFSERTVIYGMPNDLMRLTARRKDVVDHVLSTIQGLLSLESES